GAMLADSPPIGGVTSRTDAGIAYVIFGHASGQAWTDIDLAITGPLSLTSSQQGFMILGAALNDNLGHAASNAWDLHGDGIDDLLVGAWHANSTLIGGVTSRTNAGIVYVIFGRTSGQTWTDIDLAVTGPLSLTSSQQGFMILGAAGGNNLGVSVSN